MKPDSKNNRHLIDKAINEHLRDALAPYIAKELGAQYGPNDWWKRGVLDVLDYHDKQTLPMGGSYAELTDLLDSSLCLRLMEFNWKTVFIKRLSPVHRSWLNEIKTYRNDMAHPTPSNKFTDDKTERALDTLARFVEKIDPETAGLFRDMWRESKYGAGGMDVNIHDRKKGIGILTGDMKLKSWREVMQPHPDVAAGKYQQAQFAANLGQVADGQGSAEYVDPVEFFNRTYVTAGMRRLLIQSLQRVHDGNGDPVIQLKTTFGGGKTHSMLALYHIFHGQFRSSQCENVDHVLAEAGLSVVPGNVRVAVFDGTKGDPTKARRPVNMPGITIHTIWGEICAQLAFAAGKPELYDMVKESDRKGVAPGWEVLRDLFDACGACVILIDELVAYGRKLYGKDDLPAGTLGNLISFVQELTEAAKASRRSLVIASIPESDKEIGGQAGQAVLDQIEHTFGRIEAIWQPVAASESFEVVRRRLFMPCKDTKAREDICAAFSRLYGENPTSFPKDAADPEYHRKLLACYPIHPEFFDYLYNEWASIQDFQKTRGVLRLMAGVIYQLWSGGDASCMIMPGAIPLFVPQIRDELTRYLPENWNSIVDSEVDGEGSKPVQLDNDNQWFGTLLASRRVARTIFLASAPSVREQQLRGVEETHVRLGVILPTEDNAISTFNDAIGKLKSKLTYLYAANGRLWYDNRPTLKKIVQELADRIPADQVEQELKARLDKWNGGQALFVGGIHRYPGQTLDVPDTDSLRLVLLPFAALHERGQKSSPALQKAGELLDMRGTAPRLYKNMLVFLAPDKKLMHDLQKSACKYIAWQKVNDEAGERNLDAVQLREARASLADVEKTMLMRLSQTYEWLLIPETTVDDMKKTKWNEYQISCTEGDNIKAAADKLVSLEEAITSWAPSLLRMKLDELLWKDVCEVQVGRLWDYFASYCYLPRLTSYAVLAEAIAGGVTGKDPMGKPWFGLADYKDGEGNYQGIQSPDGLISPTKSQLLVKPQLIEAQQDKERAAEASRRQQEAASEQAEEEGSAAPYGDSTGNGAGTAAVHETGGGHTAGTGRESAPERKNKRFFMTADLTPINATGELSKYMEEVISHLLRLPGERVRISLEVEAVNEDKTPENIVRIVKENCRTLGIGDDNCGFEEE